MIKREGAGRLLGKVETWTTLHALLLALLLIIAGLTVRIYYAGACYLNP